MSFLNKRKSTQAIQYSSQKTMKIMAYVRTFFLLSAVGLSLYIYFSWQDLLEKLDDNRTISSFVLSGETQFTQYDDIRDSIIKMGGLKGFFSQDIAVVREQIETMPWIKTAVVRKIWPDKLSIALQEHQTVAIWNEVDFLSNEGKVFQLPMEKLVQKNLPVLAGPDYQSDLVLTTWYKLEANLKQKGLILKKLSIDERGSWKATLDNDLVLKLGRGAWQEKLDRFVTIYPQIDIPENKKLDYIDLRYDVGAAVGFTNKSVN